MLKKSVGNMYEWVTHVHAHLGGKCGHECAYCYVQRNRFGVSPRYQGDVRIFGNEFSVDYGRDKVIFIEHMNDLFAAGVPDAFIDKILGHCCRYPGNKYVFQTKNPERVHRWLNRFPPSFIIGTTLESNRHYPEVMGKSPTPAQRVAGMKRLPAGFITIEPILDFDVNEFARFIHEVRPLFVNIGADSKRCGLPEPTAEKVEKFVEVLRSFEVQIRNKSNLGRLLGGTGK